MIIELSNEEFEIFKFFMNNSFNSLNEIICDDLLSPDFIFPGIYDIHNKTEFKNFLIKMKDYGIDIKDLYNRRIKPEKEYDSLNF